MVVCRVQHRPGAAANMGFEVVCAGAVTVQYSKYDSRRDVQPSL